MAYRYGYGRSQQLNEKGGVGKIRHTIERGRGATYASGRWTVYAHDRYPRSSVLAGQDRRTFVDSYDSLDLAKAAWPKAEVLEGSTYRDIDAMTRHLPDDGDY